MKKKSFIAFFLAVIMALPGCGSEGRCIWDINALDYVNLCDYENLEIPEGYTEISETDVENIMSWDFSSSESYVEIKDRKQVQMGDILLLSVSLEGTGDAEELYYEVGDTDLFKDPSLFSGHSIGDMLASECDMGAGAKPVSVTILGIFRLPELTDTEFITDYYGLGSMEEVESYIRRRAGEEIIYNYVWEYIYENTEITGTPKSLETAIAADIEKAEISGDGNSVASSGSEVQMTYGDSFDSLYAYYQEGLIAKALLEENQVTISQTDLQNEKAALADALEVPMEDVSQYYSEDEIYYNIIMDLTRETILRLFQTF